MDEKIIIVVNPTLKYNLSTHHYTSTFCIYNHRHTYRVFKTTTQKTHSNQAFHVLPRGEDVSIVVCEASRISRWWPFQRNRCEVLVGGLGTLPELEEPQALVLEEDGNFERFDVKFLELNKWGGFVGWIEHFLGFVLTFRFFGLYTSNSGWLMIVRIL